MALLLTIVLSIGQYCGQVPHISHLSASIKYWLSHQSIAPFLQNGAQEPHWMQIS